MFKVLGIVFILNMYARVSSIFAFIICKEASRNVYMQFCLASLLIVCVCRNNLCRQKFLPLRLLQLRLTPYSSIKNYHIE